MSDVEVIQHAALHYQRRDVAMPRRHGNSINKNLDRTKRKDKNEGEEEEKRDRDDDTDLTQEIA